MAEISFIVDKLCQEPFNKNLTLVTFDEQSPFDLLNLLNEVFVHLDERHKVDIRDEAPEATGTRMVDFLKILNYSISPNSIHEFKAALANGERSAIYPVLHWVLNRREALQKRAYLARYLVSVEIPPAYLHDESVQDVYHQYKQLQQEFKETHKTVDRLRQNTLAPGELKKEITQLEEEKHQLKEKIAVLKKKTDSMSGFEELFKVTSALRREQEEEGKLQDRHREQRAALENAEQRYQQASRKLGEMNAAYEGNVPPIELLENLRREVQENKTNLKRIAKQEINQQKRRLQELQQSLREPVKTLTDVQDMQSSVAEMEQEIDDMNSELSRLQRSGGGDDKLKRYRQQSSVVANKLQQKVEELEDVEQETAKLDKAYEEKEQLIAEMAGPKFMRKEEFKQYAVTLRTKTNHYKKLKQELAAIRAESVVLGRTEAILKGRCPDLEEFLKNFEARKNKAHEQQRAGAYTTDEDGKQSVEEISRNVTELKQSISQKKAMLAPQIKELRTVRQSFQTLEQDYLDKKAIYENTAVGLESEKIKLEQECDAHQEECLREESRFHYLNSLVQICDVQLQRVKEELEYQKGNGRLRRDFKCHEDLYQSKIQQQEQLSKELRKRKKKLNEVEGENAEQRQMFVDLKKILAIKVQVAQNQDRLPIGNEDGVLDLGQDIGGANVMTIEQG